MAAGRPPRGPCGGAGVRPRSGDASGAGFVLAVEHDDRLGAREKQCLLLLGHALAAGLVTRQAAERRMTRYLDAGETELALEELTAWLEARGADASFQSTHLRHRD